ncbi:MAG: MerR family transcriptional regulator [Dysgonamonadaceae bacterium]|nr:MerR family transcriptional regulator [Dysgonamonadaceae bacterium]
MKRSFYSITEVAEELGVNASKLRYWEFLGLFKVRRTDGKRRQYRREDIEIIRAVCLLREKQGMTLKGVGNKLSNSKTTVVTDAAVIFRLQSVRDKLQAIRSEFDNLSNK